MADHSEYIPQCFYKHVNERPNDVYLTQPLAGGKLKTYTFAEVLDEEKAPIHVQRIDLRSAQARLAQPGVDRHHRPAVFRQMRNGAI